MAKNNSTDVAPPLQSSDAGGSSVKKEVNNKGTLHGEKVKAPPQSKAPPESTGKSKDEATFNSPTRKQENADIAALTEGLGSVSIAPKPSLKEMTAPESIKNVAALLSSNKYKNIVILTGAGISCNAGIPDFRTPGTGLYDNLQKYNLPFPEAVFDLGFYKNNPDPFVQLASELWPGLRHSPTITHSFIALLEKKGLLLRNYTQNIDMLDILAGVSEDKMIECHGHFRTALCTKCKGTFDGEECKAIIVEEKRAPICQRKQQQQYNRRRSSSSKKAQGVEGKEEHCGGYVKPDIVFFGEALPSRYHRLVKQDMKKADLLIVMGTCKYKTRGDRVWELLITSVQRDSTPKEQGATRISRFLEAR
mmetsp:Transcript_27582/g.58920  ORF Transcript_27582/g.58920 Transcript_27582/m.58920 type:complete len:363 (+) Transcript_27582:167-1255(+)